MDADRIAKIMQWTQFYADLGKLAEKMPLLDNAKIVCSGSLTPEQINSARGRKAFVVDPNGIGFALVRSRKSPLFAKEGEK